MSDAMTAPPERVRAMTRAGYWRDETLTACLDRWARERPDALAAVDGERRYPWSTLARAVERVAHGLATHGVESLTVLVQMATEVVELVLTDLDMPGVNGWDVIDGAKARNPDLPVLLVTGWGHNACASEGRRRPDAVVPTVSR